MGAGREPCDTGVAVCETVPARPGVVGDAVTVRADATPVPPGVARVAAAVPAVGTKIGHFEVQHLVGEGGMGVVVAAWDPDLARRVAIKLLRPERVAGSSRDRLLREARAMAQLSHRNVVAVYEAGTWREQVFVAMEYAEGGTLREWLAANRRPWRAVLPLLLAAGRGLAAAHAAGLVHRDFKPDNILLDRDEVPRVADFGMVGIGDGDVADTLRSGDSSQELTQAGAVFGTPPYMSAEQHRGERVGPAGDQFAFCVTAWEALFGVRPYQAASVRRLAARIEQGRIVEPPADADVPAWIRKTLERGLAPRPEDRWPQMESLLARLEHDPSVGRRARVRLLIGGGGAAIVAGVAVAALASVGDRRDPCGSAAARLDDVWNLGRRSELQRAFAALDVERAASTAERVTGLLDERAGRWKTARIEACRASEVRGEQSAALLDRRIACLDQRLAEQDALTGVLTRSAAEVLDHAVVAVDQLRGVEECSDLERLLEVAPPPADPEVRARVDAIAARLAAAGAEFHTGSFEAAQQQTTTVIASAREVAHAPLLADALLLMGRIEKARMALAAAERAWLEAVAAAGQAHDSRRVAEAWLGLLDFLATETDRPGEAALALTAADAAIADAGTPAALAVQRAAGAGVLAHREGRYQAAVEALERALALTEEQEGREALTAGDLVFRLGNVLLDAGRIEEATRYYQRALAIARAGLGPQHPTVAHRLNGLAGVGTVRGDVTGAIALRREALVIAEASLGKDHPDVAGLRMNLALDLDTSGDAIGAVAVYREVIAAWVKALGPNHTDVALARGNLALALNASGDVSGARAEIAASLRAYEGALGPDHPELAWGLGVAAQFELTAGDASAARALAERAIGLGAKLAPTDTYVLTARRLRASALLAQGEQAAAAAELRDLVSATDGADLPVIRGPALRELAKIELARHDHDAAQRLIDEAIEVSRGGEQVRETADSLYLRAAILWARGDRKAARASAKEARTLLADGDSIAVKELDAWLEAHPAR